MYASDYGLSEFGIFIYNIVTDISEYSALTNTIVIPILLV